MDESLKNRRAREGDKSSLRVFFPCKEGKEGLKESIYLMQSGRVKNGNDEIRIGKWVAFNFLPFLG